jgi:hypothetical protein
MLKWLLWLFSGVGIAVMMFLYRLITQHFRKRKLVATPAKEQFLVKIIEGLPVTDSLTADAIMTRIKEAPFLQQHDIKKHYIGLRVTWDGSFVSAEKRGSDLIRLQICVGWKVEKINMVFVNIIPSQYPGIGLLKYGHSIQVSGAISEINNYFVLRDARIEYKLNSLSK